MAASALATFEIRAQSWPSKSLQQKGAEHPAMSPMAESNVLPLPYPRGRAARYVAGVPPPRRIRVLQVGMCACACKDILHAA